MQTVQDKPGSNSGSSNSSKAGSSGNGTEKFANIKSANRKIRLIDVMRGYGFRIEKNHQRPTWSNNIKCPLPSHKGARERTPSFGYCFVSDHFHCMGCGKSGRGVEFISLYENVPRGAVADKILSQYGDDVSEDDFKEYQDDLTPILLEGSKYIQGIVQKHKNDPVVLEKIDKLMWWLDFYLMAKVPNQAVRPDELAYRLQRVKELLKEYDDS